MTRTPAPGAPDMDDLHDGPGAVREGAAARPPPPDRPRLHRWVVWCLVALAALSTVAGAAAWRRHQERLIVAASVARAQHLIRSDTWLGAHEAAALLGVRAAQLDPVEAAPLRAFALALLAADWRDRSAAAEAAALADAAQRSERVPPYANLATAALALGDRQAGTALEYINRASDGPWPAILAARVAIQAGNAAAAAEAVEGALAADPDHPAALAVKGDLLRRAGRDEEARGLYRRAFTASAAELAAGFAGAAPPAGAAAPHPRSTFGMAKLALSRRGAPDEAVAALARLASDAAGTPQVERARAALHLSALRGRTGDRAGAAAALDAAGLGGEMRAWVERAAGQLEVERGPYRVPDRTPAALESAADDDPWVATPPPPPPAPSTPARQVLHGFKVHGGQHNAAKATPGRPAKEAAKKKTARKAKKPAPASR
jgi:tetratricopeptide (TPR) repeat protein